MAKLKFSIHPLFFLFGLYFACTGRIFVFLTYTLVAVIHELGHAGTAAKLGYRLNRIVLMPYGAVVHGEIKGLKLQDEISVALAGPMINFACAVFFAALWWVFPESYAFTDIAMFASLSIATINLLPCRPLDGGRILLATLRLHVKERTANAILLVSGIAFSCVLGGLFVFTCFNKVNFSLLFFAAFALFGSVFAPKDLRYVKIYENLYPRALERGAEIKRIALSEAATVKRMLSLMGGDALTEVEIFSAEGKPLRILSPKEVCDVAAGDSLYTKLGEIIADKIPGQKA